MSRILFAAKHCWTALHMSRPIGQWKERKIIWKSLKYSSLINLKCIARQVDGNRPFPSYPNPCAESRLGTKPVIWWFFILAQERKKKGFAQSLVLKCNSDMVCWYPQKIGINWTPLIQSEISIFFSDRIVRWLSQFDWLAVARTVTVNRYGALLSISRYWPVCNKGRVQ